MSSTIELIETLDSHIDAAFDVLEAKGVEVPAGATLSDMAAEVAEIPSSGSDWGRVLYYSVWTSEYYSQYESSVTINSIDQSKFQTFVDNHDGKTDWSFNYEWGTWSTWYEPGGGGEEPGEPVQLWFSTEEMKDDLGIDLTLDDFPDPEMEFASFSMSYRVTVDTTSPTSSTDVTDETEYLSLNGESGSDTWTIGGVTIPSMAIKGFTSGKRPDYIPAGFLRECRNITTIELTSNIKELRDAAFYACSSINSEIDFSNIETIGNYCLYNWSAYTSPADFKNVKTIGSNFMRGCDRYTSPIVLESVTSIGNNFGGGASSSVILGKEGRVTPISIGGSFRSGLQLANPVTILSPVSIGDSFLQRNTVFNQPLPFDKITAIGKYFLSNCTAYNQPINFTGTSVGSNFLDSCIAFNSSVTLNNVTTVGTSFMRGCQNFDQQVSLPNATTIGTHFMYQCFNLTHAPSIPKITAIPGQFLVACQKLNSVIDLSNVKTIGDEFLSSCSVFNQVLDLSNVETIGNSFLAYCSKYNQPIDFTGVSSIGNYCLQGGTSYGRYAFNSAMTLTGVKTIGTYFLYNQREFTQDIYLPSSLTALGGYFLYNAMNMTGTVHLGDLAATVAASDPCSFSASVNTALIYRTGVTIEGTYAADWKTRFPDSTSNPFRKLIIAS